MKPKILLSLLSLSLLFQIPIFVSAENKTKSSTFTVQTIFTNTQNDPNASYFSIDGAGGNKYTLQFKLKNALDAPNTVNVSFENALTSPSGSIDYQGGTETLYASFNDENYAFKDYVDGPDAIELGPKEEKDVSYTISIPKKLSKGEMLGAFGFMDKADSELVIKESDTSGATLHSRMRYVIATLVSLPETALPSLKVTEAKINTETVHPKIELTMKNESAKLLKDLTLNYKVYKTSNPDDTLFERERKIERITPVTDVTYLVDFEARVFEEGKYEIELELNGSPLGETIKTTLPFEITFKEQGDYGDKTTDETIIPIAKPTTWLDYIWLGAFGLALFGLGLFIPFWKRRKEDKKTLESLKESQATVAEEEVYGPKELKDIEEEK